MDYEDNLRLEFDKKEIDGLNKDKTEFCSSIKIILSFTRFSK